MRKTFSRLRVQAETLRQDAANPPAEWADAFDAVYLSSDHRMKKPEPRFLQKLLTEQHLRPEESVFIGNDLDTDIALAQACGLDGVYLNTFAWSRRKIRAHVRMHSLDLSKITMIDSGDLSEWKA